MTNPSEPSGLERLIDAARGLVRRSFAEYSPDFDDLFGHVDTFLGDAAVPSLEKAMYLLLNQFVGDQQDYFVVPRERVRVPEVYELTPPGYKDYEVDFAVYSGSSSRFVKIAVECDGIRSHRERHSDRDRHKDVNMQAAGWTVLRFGSREIQDELEKLTADDTHVNRFVTVIENVVAGQSDALTRRNYHRFVGQLTGYTYGHVECSCGQASWGPLELTRKCGKCGAAIRAGKR